MKRAAELFTLETRVSGSRFVEEMWETRSVPERSFISVAATHWGMCVTRRRGTAQLTVRGPQTRATVAPIPRDTEFFGIQVSLGTFMPWLPPGDLLDRAVALPPISSTSFRFDRSTWELPGPDDADAFLEDLVDAGMLVHDPIAAAAVQGDVDGLSTRSVERRVARATGLTRGVIRRIRRAEQAAELLSRGVPPSDAAHGAGYADQPHLTRSLKRFVGQTPAQVAASAAGDT